MEQHESTGLFETMKKATSVDFEGCQVSVPVQPRQILPRSEGELHMMLDKDDGHEHGSAATWRMGVFLRGSAGMMM